MAGGSQIVINSNGIITTPKFKVHATQHVFTGASVANLKAFTYTAFTTFR